MNELKQVLLSQLETIFKEHEHCEQIKSIALILASQNKTFQNLLLSYKILAENYSYSPLFGSDIDFQFRHSDRQVVIIKEGVEITLSVQEFNQLCSLIDVLFTPIYPLGTVVELKEELFSEEVQSYFKSRNMGMYAVLHARRYMVTGDDYIDYLGSLWPMGVVKEADTMSISSYMIKEVVFEGFTNNVEEDYVMNNLRQTFLNEGKQSILFQREEDEE